MHYISSPKISRALDFQMRVDPRVIKWTTLKLGHRPEDMVETDEKTVARDARRTIGLEMENQLQKQIHKRVMEEL
jgi:small subunit ribosomal protein S6